MTIRQVKFVLFGNFKELEAQPETILSISTNLLQNGLSLVPGTFQQFNPRYGMKTHERIMFSNSKERIATQIGVDAIDVNSLIIEKKPYNFSGHMDVFLSRVKKIIKSIKNSNQPLNDGSRISLIIENFYDPSNIKPFHEIYSTINNTLPSYNKEETFEWSTRAVKRNNFSIQGKEEVVNVVSEVAKIQGHLNSFGYEQEFDTIHTKIDINTVLDNSKPRINEEFIEDFLNKAIDLFTSINAEIEVKINGNG
jgi:hypothetical protein